MRNRIGILKSCLDSAGVLDYCFCSLVGAFMWVAQRHWWHIYIGSEKIVICLKHNDKLYIFYLGLWFSSFVCLLGILFSFALSSIVLWVWQFPFKRFRNNFSWLPVKVCIYSDGSWELCCCGLVCSRQGLLTQMSQSGSTVGWSSGKVS